MSTGNPEQLFEDKRQLSREQVFERYMLPADYFEGSPLPDEMWEKRGHGEEALIRPTASYIMPQIRKTYDAEHFENLGRNICTSENGQLQNGAVALIDAEHIDSYLTDLNNFFETEIPLEDIPFHEQFGGYLVTIFGHNRQIGIASYNLSKSGHPDIGVPFDVKVYRNPRFWRVLSMQAAENTGQAPDLWERSRAIVHYEQLRSRDGVPATNEETAKVFGIDEAQIIKARRYESLPSEIKELVESKVMVYSAAVEMTPLYGYYDEKTICALAKQFANENRSSKQVEKAVKLRINAIQLTPEIAVYAEAEHISYSQVNQLFRLKKINEPVEGLNLLAKIMMRDRLNEAQSKKLVDRRIEEITTNTRDFWHDPGLTQDEIKSQTAKPDIDDGTTHRVGTRLDHVLKELQSIHSQTELGIIDQETVRRLNVPDRLDKELSDIFDEIENGADSGITPEAIDQLTQLVQTFERVENGGHRNILIDKVSELNRRVKSLGEKVVQDSLFV